MSEKIYNLRAGYYYEYTGICINKKENLTTNEVVDKLNEQDDKIKQLEKELSEMKDKAFVYGENLIWERSSTISKDTEELRIEIYGKEKAEQLKKQEIEEDKKLYSRKATYADFIPVWKR